MSRPSPALRDELNRLNSPQRAPLTPEDVRKIGRIMLWRIIVEPREPKRASGMIDMPEDVIKAEEYSTTIGRVLQIGHFAFKSKTAAGLDLSEEPNIPKVGEWVLYQVYAGQEIKLRGNRKLRALNETEILMVVDDPEQIVSYL